MKHSRLSKVLTMLLAVMMLVSALPLGALAAGATYDDSNGGSTYYQLISKKNWDLAPGIVEEEVVLNNDAGSRRQVLHTVSVDMNNEYTKVIPGYKGMIPTEGNYGTEATSTQAKNAEKLGYGNVVAATNAMLSWYSEAYYQKNPHLIGEPLYYSILDGYYYENSQGAASFSSGNAVVVVNYDYHPLTGEKRPDDMPKLLMRSQTDPLTGWEQNAIAAWGWLVKPDANGKPTNVAGKEDHGASIASRTFVGIKADGTLVLAVCDGEQAPYSTGFTHYEMADYMIKMGCVYAANCDGGGSTTFCTQRPGEDLKVNCSLSDGGERPTTSTFLVISTAPADGVFARATIESEYNYYVPGSSVTFTAMGTDAVGTKVDIPADVTWAIKEDGMGTIENGVFTSNGTEGTVTAQMIYDGKVVGERTVTIAAPENIYFAQSVVTIPFGKTAIIPVKASLGGGLVEIGLSANDVSFTTDNEALGQFSGLNFIAVDEENAPENLTSTVTATLKTNTSLTATVQLNLGKASEVLWDFEDGQVDIDEWNVINSRTNDYRDYYLKLSLADKTNGQVHDGNYSMRLEVNGLSSKKSDSSDYAWIRLGVDGEALVLENARSVGFWLYVPEDNIQCWVQGHYMTDSDGDGTYDNLATVSMMESENVYYNIDESGWHYMSMDISAFEKVALKYSNQFNLQDANGQTTGQTAEKGEFFLAIVTHRTKNNILWQTNGSINGPYTYYLDGFTVDYSEAVDDRENPVFDKIYLDGTTALVKRDVVTTNNNVLNLSAAVADATYKEDALQNRYPLTNVSGLDPDSAKVYIDGIQVPCTFANGVISANGNTVADGYHRVKFEICDNAGNKSVIIRVVKVESGAASSTINLVPADATLDRIPYGSIYWMNMEATAIETIDTVQTVIDLNSVNHWQLDHMVLADGFSAEYTIAEETNTATITITRTGENEQTGAAVLAQIPVRIIYFDTDIKVPGFTAQTFWTSYNFFPQDMKMDVDMSLITHVDGTTSTFSNEEFHVDTETYTTNAAMDKVYFTEHGTTHVHTPAAIADKAPTCTQPGYTGRTFCAGCNSVVEWGTTVPATGHTYKVVGDKLICDCGAESKATGLHIIDGKGYYTIAGTLTTGWLTIDDEWYYFDETTYSSVPTHFNGYVTYEFEPDGKLISGQWHKSAAGIRYYEGPSYIRGGKGVMTWFEIDGEMYCINRQGYVATGTRWVDDDNVNHVYTWYVFDENGASQGKYNHTGLAEWNGDLYYLKNGVSEYGMHLVDGKYYYFYANYRAALKNQEYYCKYNKGLLPEGYYTYGNDGVMLNETVYNGVFNADGYLYYYEMGKKSQGTGVFTYNGVDYPIEADGMVLFTGTLTDASGQTLDYVDGFHDHIPMNGIYGDYYYVNDVQQKAYQLFEYEGSYYFLNDGNKIFRNGKLFLSEKFLTGATLPDGSPFPAGLYIFDADGKITNVPYEEPTEPTEPEVTDPTDPTDPDPTEPEVKNGIEGDYYYVDGVRQKSCMLFSWEGNYYFLNDGDKIFRNGKLYLSERFVTGMTLPDGSAFPVGLYVFDADGKITNLPETDSGSTPEAKNGIDGDYYYVDGVRQKSCMLFSWEGNYYFLNDGDKIFRNGKLYLSERFVTGMTLPDGSAFPVGLYVFDADGKITNLPETDSGSTPEAKNGIDGDYYYVDGVRQKSCLLFSWEGDYYFLNDGDKIFRNGKLYLSEKFVTGMTLPDGSAFPAGLYVFGADGKITNLPVTDSGSTPEAKNGIDGDYYYVDGVRQKSCMLFSWEGDYYFLNDGDKIFRNGKLYLSERFVTGMTLPDGSAFPVGLYIFDADGKITNLPG